LFVVFDGREITRTTCISLSKWSKVEHLYRKNVTVKTDSKQQELCKNQGEGVKTAVGSELSLVSGTYHENFGSVVMEMASFSLKIRHVFGDTSLTERSIGAGPPVIIQLSDRNTHSNPRPRSLMNFRLR
jgi:hypothetical protein